MSSPFRFVSNPDLAAVSELMVRTWSRPCWKYTPEFLGAYVYRPTGDPDLSVGLYCGEELAAYEAMVPYAIHYGGRPFRVAQTGFWTADPKFSSSAVAWRVFRKVVHLAREKGVAGCFAVIEASTQAEEVFQAATRQMKQAVRIVCTFRQLIGLTKSIRVKLGTDGSAHGSAYTPEHSDECVQFFATLRASVSLTRDLDTEDINFVLQDRANTFSWVFINGSKVRGIVNTVRVELLRPRGAVVSGLLDHVLLGDLNEEERKAFLRAVFRDPFWENIDVVTVPTMGYFDPRALKAFGFFPALQEFRLYYMPFHDTLDVREVSSFHLDLL